MRPGVEGQLEEQIEESLENLDNLLNNIKSKDPTKREQEILKLGHKLNIIDFNLNQDQTDVVSHYGNKGASQGQTQQPKVFAYKQPF